MKSLFGFLFIVIFILCQGSVLAYEGRKDFDWDKVKALAIQDKGRMKPLDTFAFESVLFVTGRRSWKGKGAVETVFGWLLAYEEEWKDERFIVVDHKPLKRVVGLDENSKYFSPVELQNSSGLQQLLQVASNKESQQQVLSPVEKEALQAWNRWALVENISSGRAWNILPDPEGTERNWFSLWQLTIKETIPYPQEDVQKLSVFLKRALTAFLARNAGDWNKWAVEFVTYVRDGLGKGTQYPLPSGISMETHYNSVRPFRTAWMFYLLAALMLSISVFVPRKALSWAGLGLLVLGLFFNTYGFVLRSLISGRAPVTNMYESVVWVAWGSVFLSLLIWAFYRNQIILILGSVFSVVGLILADSAPAVLDPGIHPLTPVLRSNFWLTTHVLSITLSYSAFAIALCFGNLVLAAYGFKSDSLKKGDEYLNFMYRGVQIGVVLLAAGTILGGVWADYSWGRFWGWDPKEVWALVTLLIYLTILHGRFAAWLSSFGFAVATVLSFLSVLMAWYGVNFVLGVGLHAYGFGSGGWSWMLLFVFVQLVYIAICWVQYRRKRTRFSDSVTAT